MDLRYLFSQLDWRSLLDILLVTFLVYQVLAMLKGTRAAQILIGLLIIFVVYALSNLLQLETMNWIVNKVYSSLLIVLIILFQDDIRRLLTRMGSGPFSSKLEGESGLRVIDEVISAAKNLSHDRLGAIVVFERGVNLERLHDYGIRVDSQMSEEILICIFQSFSPLHDGAVIVRNNRLSAASTQLPLSKNPDLTKKIGTRHSASLGISEETDAVALVISEETGHISIACDGELYRQASPEAARRMLIQLLLPAQKTARWRLFLRRLSRSRPQWGDPGFKKSSQKSELAKEIVKKERAGASAHTDATVGSMAMRLPKKSGLSVEVMDASRFVISDKHQNEMEVHSVGLFDDSTPNVDVAEHFETNGDDEEVYKQNQALRSLSQLGPEDKFIPPSVPVVAPPRDVSIGGVSINPPIDPDAIDSDEQGPKSKDMESTEK